MANPAGGHIARVTERWITLTDQTDETDGDGRRQSMPRRATGAVTQPQAAGLRDAGGGPQARWRGCAAAGGRVTDAGARASGLDANAVAGPRRGECDCGTRVTGR